MSKHIQFTNGILSARFDSAINTVIPADSIEVADEVFFQTINEQDGIWSLVNGDVVKLPPPPETPEQIIARLESAVDKYLNEQAESLRYESIKTIVSYRDDPNPKFKAEGIAGYQLRSAVYTSSIQLIEDVLNGIKEVPTEEELLTSLPKITDYLVYE